jgi:hypothetical protein
VKKTLMLIAAAVLALCASVVPANAGGNPVCPPGVVCNP